ncbi:MAG: hypothetical protein ACYC6L_01680 [Anaerolineae bacterium]
MKIAWRLDVSQWITDQQFTRIFSILRENKPVVDEVSLFIGDERVWYGYIPLEEIARQLAVARERIPALKALGIPSVGFNLWPCLGSDGYGTDLKPPLPFQGMVGWNGQLSNAAPCVNSPGFHGYWAARMGLLAREHPDFIWVDDDLRLTHLGPPYPCFCPTCVAKFQDGSWASREQLVAALNLPENGALRLAWTDFNADSLAELCAIAEKTIHGEGESIEIGLMTVGLTHTTYSGDYIRRCMTALQSPRGRPGHGFYTDSHPRELLVKMQDVGCQLREYPDRVTEIQYEHEEYPHTPLEKASQTVCNEITCALGVGCTGVALNHFPYFATSLDSYTPLLTHLAVQRPAWEALTAANIGTQPAGLWPAASALLMGKRAVDERGWFSESNPAYDITASARLGEFGFPLTYQPDNACAALLAGHIAESLDDAVLKEWLSRAVVVDSQALDVLWKRGLGQYLGVRPGERFTGVCERYTDHPLNAGHAGDGRMTLEPGWALEPQSTEVQVFSRLEGIGGEDCGPCVTAFENILGGRVVALGITPFRLLGDAAKWNQICTLLEWVTRGQLPVLIDRPLRVTPFVRFDQMRTRASIVLLNNSLDATGSFRLTVRCRCVTLSLVRADGQLESLEVNQLDDAITATIPNIPAWHTAVLVGG